MFTADQVSGWIRQFLPLIGAVLTMFGFTHLADGLAANMVTILQFAGPLSIILSFVWSTIANSKLSILKSVAKMPELAAPVKVTDPELAAAVEGPNVVSVPQSQNTVNNK